MPLISVIVPAHNAAPFLADAVASVRAQSFDDWEMVIVDDGSTDGTGDLGRDLAAEDGRIKALTLERSGLSGARNAGLAATAGDLLQFLDADDTLLPHKLRHQSQWLARRSACDVVFGRGQVVGADGQVPLRFWVPRRDYLSALLTRNFILVNAALVRRSALERVGGFKERSTTRLPIYGCEDWDLWLRLAAAGSRIEYVDELVVRNRWRDDRMSGNDLLMKRSALWVVEEAGAEGHPLSRRQRLLLRNQLFYRRCVYLLALLVAGETTEAEREGAAILADYAHRPEARFVRWLQRIDEAPVGRGALFALGAQAVRVMGRLPTLPDRFAAMSLPW